MGLGVLGVQWWVAILSRMAGVDLTEMTFEQRLEGSEGISHVDMEIYMIYGTI